MALAALLIQPLEVDRFGIRILRIGIGSHADIFHVVQCNESRWSARFIFTIFLPFSSLLYVFRGSTRRDRFEND